MMHLALGWAPPRQGQAEGVGMRAAVMRSLTAQPTAQREWRSRITAK